MTHKTAHNTSAGKKMKEALSPSITTAAEKAIIENNHAINVMTIVCGFP